MRHINSILMVVCAFLFSVPSVYAQQDISVEIDETVKDGQLTSSDQNQQGRIDNIPVEILFDVDEAALVTGSILIVSAYAPPPSNVRRSIPLLLGQTQLLLTEMAPPLKVIIAAPSAITQDLEYVRIEASIIDTNGTAIYELKEPGKYEGYEATTLNLSRIGESIVEEPVVNTAEFTSETVRGKIKLSGSPPKFKGSNLVVRLVEEGLAGGNSSKITGEARQILDGKRAPFAFKFERVMDPSRTAIPLVLEVWIEDWAGRKTHVTPAPTPYTGPKTRYRIRLDAIGPQVYNPMPSKVAIRKAISKTVATKKTVAWKKPKLKTKSKPKQKKTVVVKTNPVVKNKKVVLAKIEVKPKLKSKLKSKPKPKPKPVTKLTSLSPYQKITGKAHFNANKGLPRGSVLIAELERRNNGSRPALLASTRVFLDGLSGNITFKLKANTADLDPALPPARLRVRVEDKNGKLFFSNRGGTSVRKGFNTVKLTTSPNY